MEGVTDNNKAVAPTVTLMERSGDQARLNDEVANCIDGVRPSTLPLYPACPALASGLI